MNSLRSGAIRLFNLAGINVYLHWSWLLVAVFEIGGRQSAYSTIAWNIAEYLSLFAIVLTHEYGHALACRSVGGVANQIVLWPLGGVAFVNPPPRPAATLWSIASGPLVNVALAPNFYAAFWFARSSGWAQTMPDAYLFVRTILEIDVALFIFNMLPIYPLDGGQILRSLLWFGLGRARSLMTAAVIGIIGAAGFALWAFRTEDTWLGLIAVFVGLNCWQGLKAARALGRFDKLPRHSAFSCPSCKVSPPMGAYWHCSNCGASFDTFQAQAICPNCSKHFAATTCMDCGRAFSTHRLDFHRRRCRHP